MQKHNLSEGETLNNHKETENTEFNDAVELGSLTTATYYQSHGRERQRRSRKQEIRGTADATSLLGPNGPIGA